MGTEIVYDNVWSMDELVETIEKYGRFALDKEGERRFQNFFSIKEDHTTFIQQNSPIFVITHNEKACCPINPVNHTQFKYTLKDFQFDKIVDDKEAYSKLVDYINFLGMEHKTIPQMTDSNKIDSHGFDKKSFRKKRIG